MAQKLEMMYAAVKKELYKIQKRFVLPKFQPVKGILRTIIRMVIVYKNIKYKIKNNIKDIKIKQNNKHAF